VSSELALLIVMIKQMISAMNTMNNTEQQVQ
jgi:hypothetical protein